MPELCDLRIHVNGQQTFFLNEKIISGFSGKLRKVIAQEKRRSQIKNSGIGIEIEDFPGGPDGFELISRFCYNSGRIRITVLNIAILRCCALFLGMTEKITQSNLFSQTEDFLEEHFHWSWIDTITCLKSCESFFLYADSSGLIESLIISLISKISHNSDPNSPFASSSSSSSSSELLNKSNKFWWFEELTVLPPIIIQKFIKTLDSYGAYNNTIITRFILYYLKTSSQSKSTSSRSSYGGLADRAAYGVSLMGKKAFSCRGLFWVLKIVSGFGVSKDYKISLEKLIGKLLDEAKLDDLLVSGGGDGDGGVYDVSLVVRLIRVFVCSCGKVEGGEEKIRKVSGLVDKYLREIGADQKLKISKFIGVAESLPQSARQYFDGVYRAVDIYLESHPSLSMEERSRICRCLNYKKLSLEVCKELAKNPRIPPLVSIQALASQHANILKSIPKEDNLFTSNSNTPISSRSSKSKSKSKSKSSKQVAFYNMGDQVKRFENKKSNNNGRKEEEDDGLMRMQWKLVELEKTCRGMKGQISLMKNSGTALIVPSFTRNLPSMC